MSTPDNSLEILYTAVGTSIGIVIAVSDFSACQQRLYRARKNSGDPTLDCLQFRRSPLNPETEMWIVKGTNGSENK